MTSPLERGKRRAADRQRHAEMVFAKQLTEQLDVESLLMEKIEQKTRGGIQGLRRAFRNFNTSYDQSEISFPQFKENLVRFGLPGLPEEESYKLFVKYDDDGGGTIDFEEFVGHLMKTYKSRSEIGSHQHDIQNAKRARDKMMQQRKQAERLKWQTLNVDAENLLLEKIEQRVKGGGNSLRLAFRKFKTSSAELDLAEFQRTLEKVGLQGLTSEQVAKLFAKFDADGNGTIEFNEFIDFVMSCQLQMSRSNQGNFFRNRHQDELNKAAKRVVANETVALSHFVTGEHVEASLVEKIQQHTAGGYHAIHKVFLQQSNYARRAPPTQPWESNLQPQESVRESNVTETLDFETFKQGLNRLGLRDVPEKSAAKCFKLYHPKNGEIVFSTFAKRILASLLPLQNKYARQISYNKYKGSGKGNWQGKQHRSPGAMKGELYKALDRSTNVHKCTRHRSQRHQPRVPSRDMRKECSTTKDIDCTATSVFVTPGSSGSELRSTTVRSSRRTPLPRVFRTDSMVSKPSTRTLSSSTHATIKAEANGDHVRPIHPVVVQHKVYAKLSKFGEKDDDPW